MPLLLGCLALSFPRFVLLLVWLFGGGYLQRALSSGLWLLLGALLLPLTTLAFCFATNSVGAPGDVDNLGWVLIAVAALVDLGLIGGGARRRREAA